MALAEDLKHWKLVQSTVDELLAREPIKSQGYRALIFASEIGDLLKNYTHDPIVNPDARPFEDEVTHAGDALVQLLIYLRSRNLDLAQVYSRAVARVYGKEWTDDPTSLLPTVSIPEGALAAGIAAAPGIAKGVLLRIESSWTRAKITHEVRGIPNGGRPIVAMANYNVDVWPAVSENMDSVGGLLLLRAGPLSHPANICNDEGKPCIVGVVGYEKLISGQTVEIEAGEPGSVGVIRSESTSRKKGIDEFQ